MPECEGQGVVWSGPAGPVFPVNIFAIAPEKRTGGFGVDREMTRTKVQNPWAGHKPNFAQKEMKPNEPAEQIGPTQNQKDHSNEN